MTKLNPPLPFELAVAGTDRIGIKTEAAGQFPRAWQTLSWREVVAEDAKDNLRYELFADGNFAAAGKPELHDGLSYRRSLRANHRGHRGTRGSTGDSLAADRVALVLLLTLHVFRDFGESFAVVVGAGVHGVEGVGQQKFVLARFGGIGVGGVLEGAQLGLKFGVGFDNDF